MTRKIVIEVSDITFALLEVLATGIELESGTDINTDWEGYDKKRDDFTPAVRDLVSDICTSLATGVRRGGSWEHDVVKSLTGWDGTFNNAFVADCIKDYFK
ncbi:hypothetical protein [Photobacterium leiognathi]|uniref:hypothetical protein n=1 Tax=Photobacterium leiognathi TaxID=553611 RepID=UPI002981CBAF|nr:hypothetical protein [Photobacterium leiognathi]